MSCERRSSSLDALAFHSIGVGRRRWSLANVWTQRETGAGSGSRPYRLDVQPLASRSSGNQGQGRWHVSWRGCLYLVRSIQNASDPQLSATGRIEVQRELSML